jgi:opacity protein-like surface antigen
MRFTALALATLIALGVTISAAHRAYAQEIQIEEAPADEDLGDLGSRRPGQPRKPQEPEKIWGQTGFYGVIGGTYAAEDLKNVKSQIKTQLNGDTVDFENSGGLNLRAGYRWHPHVATELEYEWVDNFQLTNTTQASAKLENIWSLTANAKAFISTGRFEPYAIFGLGYYRVGSTSERHIRVHLPDTGDFGMRAGAGIDFFIIDHLAIETEITYNFGESDLAELRYTSFTWNLMYQL